MDYRNYSEVLKKRKVIERYIMNFQGVYYFDMINRHALIVKGKKPFYDWVDSTAPDQKKVDPQNVEKSVYLIPSFDYLEDSHEWVGNNFDLIFVNELNDWYMDQTKWPKNRTYKMFKKWFDVEIASLVLDMLDEPVIKE
jgi:hypothetical protein